MENASKALLMAGGVLIAIIIIAVLTRTMSAVNTFQMANFSEEEQKQLIEYNEQFTKYVNQYMYGTEIMTVINKHNDSYNNGMVYPLNIDIEFKTPYEYDERSTDSTGKTKIEHKTTTDLNLEIKNDSSMYVAITNSTASSFRNRAFKCIGVEHDNNTGRVNKISFKEV